MTADALGALVVAALILAMVGLAVAAAQPSPANVARAADALAVLPLIVTAGLLVAWLVGR